SWKPARFLLSNWQLSGLGIFTTGAPINPVCSSSAAFPFNDPSLTGVGAIGQTPSTTTVVGYRCQEVANPQNFTQGFYSNFNTAGANTNSQTGQYTDTQPQRQMALTVRLEF